MSVQIIRVHRTDQQIDDGRRARELAEAALDRSNQQYRTIGPDRLLAAAMVYATLASR